METSELAALPWDYGMPSYVRYVTVEKEHIDVMGHTNNGVYVGWLEDLAWGHSSTLGLNWAKYEELNRAMVARRHEVDFLAATFLGDQLILGTWIIENNRKLSVTRAYQYIRPRDGVTVCRARTHWVCIALDSGKPTRMPQEFVDGYVVVDQPG